MTTFRSVASAKVAKEDWLKNDPWMVSEPFFKVGEPSCREPAKLSRAEWWQWLTLPWTQGGQVPHVK